jgi:prepilin-type N-terminal cleavage/methylation domain-containing protein
MAHAHIRRSAGFTLVETLVATAIVATAAACLAQLVSIGVRQTVAARATFEAVVAAQRKLEELRAVTWSYSVVGSNIPISPAGTLVKDTPGFVERVGGWTSRWAVLRRDPTDANVVVMQVCVFDANGTGTQPEACVSTIRTRRP